MIIIIDYGMGNIGSIAKMIRKVGGEAYVCTEPEGVLRAEKLILPGVGAFDNGMQRLKEKGFVEPLERTVIHEGRPLLGICLGMQLLTGRSDEGSLPGLGWLDAHTVRFHFNGSNTGLKIPHMGWNDISIKRPGVLFQDMYEDPAFYFVHSFHVVSNDNTQVLATATYGYEFVAAMQHDNIMATPFHPEKSHKYGMQVIRNFVEAPC